MKELVKRRVLFLFTGNSCRSQIAEAIVNNTLGRDWDACGAGSKPEMAVNEKAVHVLEEIGIVHEGHPKPVSEFKDEVFDLIVNLCDSASVECPAWIGKGRQVNLVFPDPSRADRTETETTVFFVRIRDEIMSRVVSLLKGISFLDCELVVGARSN